MQYKRDGSIRRVDANRVVIPMAAPERADVTQPVAVTLSAVVTRAWAGVAWEAALAARQNSGCRCFARAIIALMTSSAR